MGLEQLAAEGWTVKFLETREQFSVPWAFLASILFFKTPRGKQGIFHVSIPLVFGKSFLRPDSSPSGTLSFHEFLGRGEQWWSVGFFPGA